MPLQLVLISFREWLHSYPVTVVTTANIRSVGSHLFQRVASFLLMFINIPDKATLDRSHLFQRVASFLLEVLEDEYGIKIRFSSLSESGFIPTGY